MRARQDFLLLRSERSSENDSVYSAEFGHSGFSDVLDLSSVALRCRQGVQRFHFCIFQHFHFSFCAVATAISTPVSIFQPDILQLAGCSMMLSCILAREAVRLHYLGIQCGRSLRLAPSTELIAADCSMAARNLLCPCQRHLPARFGAPCANARLECELPITSGAALAGGARGEER